MKCCGPEGVTTTVKWNDETDAMRSHRILLHILSQVPTGTSNRYVLYSIPNGANLQNPATADYPNLTTLVATNSKTRERPH